MRLPRLHNAFWPVGGTCFALAMLFCFSSAWAAQVTPAQQSRLKQASEWVAQGKGAIAYKELLPLFNELAGNAEFDLLFGQAALQADHPTEAAFAFERCLSGQPLNGLCRLGMAQAHISLNEVANARTELHTLQEGAPPSQVQEVIARYLNQLDAAPEGNQDTRLTAYLQTGVGFDSNVNNATATDTMALPAFNDAVFRLSRDGRRQESGFVQAKFNISYSAPISTNWRVLAEGNLQATGNWNASHYNSLVSDVSLGLARRSGQHHFTARLMGQNYRWDNRSYRNMLGVLGQYSYSLTDHTELGFFGQASRLSYPGNRLRNANRFTLGASIMQGLANDRALMYVTAYGGRERTIKSQAPSYFNHHFVGLRTGGLWLATPRLQFEAGIGVERRRYNGQVPLFLRSRNDTFFDAYLGANYAINRKLSLRPQYRYYNSNSNIVLNDYKRHVFMVNLRYELF